MELRRFYDLITLSLPEYNDPANTTYQEVYDAYQASYELLKQAWHLYDRVRNWYTKKPYSTSKWKLYFGSPTIASGWAKGNEDKNLCAILRKGEQYFLAILAKDAILHETESPKGKKTNKKQLKYDDLKLDDPENSTKAYFEKLEYNQLPDPKKDIPKRYCSNKYQGANPAPDEIKRICNKDKKQGKTEEEQLCLIRYYQNCPKEDKDWNQWYDFKEICNTHYDNPKDFLTDVKKVAYTIHFTKLDEEKVEKAVEEGKLYLFRIFNKDFSEHSKGTPNLHTLYFKALFSAINRELQFPFKLNGGAELFFRPQTEGGAKTVHPKEEDILNKTEGYEKKTSRFAYDIIKDKRYYENQYYLHVPITINRCSLESNSSDLDEKVRNYISDAKDLHIIGIDRGERHLLYLSVIDLEGKIIEQKSLNVIPNLNFEGKIDYQQKLTTRENERKKNRQNWEEITRIKDLKQGYLSQAIYIICKKIVEYNAIVVLENLNQGFIQSRARIEKNVYSKFETMLCDKLSYLVVNKKAATELLKEDRREDENQLEAGSLFKGLQLATALEPGKNIQQNGILFFIDPWETSKTDPKTGFVNLIRPNNLKYKTIETSRKFFGRFNKIHYDGTSFLFDINNYNSLGLWLEQPMNSWQFTTAGIRLNSKKDPISGKWNNELVDVTQEMKSLLDKHHIEYKNGDNLVTAITSDQRDSSFFKKFIISLSL